MTGEPPADGESNGDGDGGAERTAAINRRWGRVLLGALVAAGVDAVCLAPGSRSTPLVLAAHEADVELFVHIDERSAAYFALGRARWTGRPTPVITTSGTAVANLHPAVIEAAQSRVPMVLLTADRPPELRGSGANQTVDQVKLFGDAVRWFRDLPEPGEEPRRLRSLRTTAARAVGSSLGPPAGPVHLNVPLRKPLVADPGDGSGWPDDDVRTAVGDVDPPESPGSVAVTRGRPTLDVTDLDGVVRAVAGAERGLLVAGPSDRLSPAAIAALARATGFPLLADPLSGCRFGPHVADDDVTVVGGYDSWLAPAVTDGWPTPDLVCRFGASPTSRTLRDYLERVGGRQLLVDPAGGWREATFTASDLVAADPTWLAERVAGALDGPLAPDAWRERFDRAERSYWALIDEASSPPAEGAVVASAIETAPDPAAVFVSNSMPVRDLDRFGRPRSASLDVYGNRGASGIDGIVSAALGVSSALEDGTPAILLTGDLAFHHDANGLAAIERCDVDVTVVLLNNDGGGIFHMLPIEGYEPPFTAGFKTPHGLDFGRVADLYGLEHVRVDGVDGFGEAYADTMDRPGSRVIEVVVDAESNHRRREALHRHVVETVDASDPDGSG